MLVCCCCFFIKYSLPSGLCNLLAIVFAHCVCTSPLPSLLSEWSTLKRRGSAFPLAGFNLKSEEPLSDGCVVISIMQNISALQIFRRLEQIYLLRLPNGADTNNDSSVEICFHKEGRLFFFSLFFFKGPFMLCAFNVQSAFWIIYCCDGVSSYSCASPFSSIRWIGHSGSPTKQWVSFLLIWLLPV